MDFPFRFPVHANELSTAELRRAAGYLGLGLGRCNPGDGAKWRVGPDALTKGRKSGLGIADFNAVDGPTLRSKAEAAAYLNGFAAGLDRGLPIYRLRVALNLALEALDINPETMEPEPGSTASAADFIREAFDLIPVHPVVGLRGKGK